MKKPWRYIKTHWRLLLLATSFSVVLVVFFNILWGDPNLAVAIVAFGTLMLALATAVSIDNNRQQEKRRRKEGLLNEIIEWAIDYRICLYSPDVLGKDQKTVYAVTHLKIVSVNARRQKMETFAQKVFGDDLFKDVYKLETSVAHYLVALEFIIGIDEKYISLDEYKKSEIRDKIKRAQAQGREEIDTVLDEYVQALVNATTHLIEKCSILITQL